MDDRWDQGDHYERFMGAWSAPIAERFVGWLDPAPGGAWLDVGCGTGALLRAIASAAAPSQLAGVDPSQAFLATAARGLPPDAELRVGDAEHLPFDDHAFDAVVSGLVLNFLPDPAAALRAMRSACRPGGVVAAYVWDYADGMQFLRHFWDVATELDAGAARLDEGRSRFPLCLPGPLSDLFEAAGLSSVKTTSIVAERRLDDFDAYWQPFLGGQGPAGSYLISLSEPERQALADRMRRRLPVADDGSITLSVRAWAVRGAA